MAADSNGQAIIFAAVVTCYFLLLFLWLPRAADADIIVLSCSLFCLLMVTLWNRADHYIFILSFVLRFCFLA